MLFDEPFNVAASIHTRCLALTNLLCFYHMLQQLPGLIGSRGILPAAEAVQQLRQKRTTYWDAPTFCLLFGASDRVLTVHCYLGIVCSVLAFSGVLSGMMLGLCGVLYLSFKSVSGPFMALQMHAVVIELDMLRLISSPWLDIQPQVLAALNWLLLSRVMIGGAAGKWSGGDTSWRDGTAMTYHYQTQPLPNPLSPFVHRLPRCCHTFETYASLVAEGLGGLVVIAPQSLRAGAFVMFAASLSLINLTGNFGPLGLATMSNAVMLLNDDVWQWLCARLLPSSIGDQVVRTLTALQSNGLSLTPILSINHFLALPCIRALPWLTIIPAYAVVSFPPLASTFHFQNPLQWLTYQQPYRLWQRLTSLELYAGYILPSLSIAWYYAVKGHSVVNKFDLASRYTKFAVMTKFRWEVIIQGSVNGQQWHDYTFKYKPDRLDKPLPIVPFGMLPALDWQCWFVALRATRGGPPPQWFYRLLVQLLKNEPTVTALFRDIPAEFADRAPTYIRALLYEYSFEHGRQQDAPQQLSAARQRCAQNVERLLPAARRTQQAIDDSNADLPHPHNNWYRVAFAGELVAPIQLSNVAGGKHS